MSQSAEEVYAQFTATLGRAIERTVARAERVLAGPDVDPVELLRIIGQLILLERLVLGIFAPLDLYREFFPSAA